MNLPRDVSRVSSLEKWKIRCWIYSRTNRTQREGFRTHSPPSTDPETELRRWGAPSRVPRVTIHDGGSTLLFRFPAKTVFTKRSRKFQIFRCPQPETAPCLEQALTPSPSYPAAGPGDGGQCHERAEHNDQKQYQQWILLTQAVVSLVEEVFAGRRPGTEEAGHGLPRPSPEPLPWGPQGAELITRPGPRPTHGAFSPLPKSLSPMPLSLQQQQGSLLDALS